MERFPRSLDEAVKLLQLSDLLRESSQTIIEEWSKESFESAPKDVPKENGLNQNTRDTSRILPSRKLHEAQRAALSIPGVLTELVSEPCSRIQEVSSQYWESRCLYLAAERRITDLLHASREMDVSEIASKTGIEPSKLSRILRLLCSIHIFKQTGPDMFANNRISAALVENEPLRAYVLLFNLDIYTASDHFPRYLLGEKGWSHDVAETAFQEAVGTIKPRWDWLAERAPPKKITNADIGYPGVPDPKNWILRPDSKGLVGRPELENFGLAMVGGGMVSGAAHPFDYPWDRLGSALVVDVGGGVGGFALQLLKLYPRLKFVVQDRAEVLKQAETDFWPKHAPEAIQSGRVVLQELDFFQVNPVKGAAVYWLRGILHDWSDEYCVQILSRLRSSMAPFSRILLCDQLMNTTYGCRELQSAPAPLPANYGYYQRYCHQRDMGVMGIINGIERTPDQLQNIIKRADLKLEKIWECRSMVAITEVRLPEQNGVPF